MRESTLLAKHLYQRPCFVPTLPVCCPIRLSGQQNRNGDATQIGTTQYSTSKIRHSFSGRFSGIRQMNRLSSLRQCTPSKSNRRFASHDEPAFSGNESPRLTNDFLDMSTFGVSTRTSGMEIVSRCWP